MGLWNHVRQGRQEQHNWVAEAVPGGVRLHGYPRWRTADLLLLADAVILERKERRIHLRWVDHGRDDATSRWGPRNIRTWWLQPLPTFGGAGNWGIRSSSTGQFVDPPGSGIGIHAVHPGVGAFRKRWWTARPLLALGVRKAVPVSMPTGIRLGIIEPRRDTLAALLDLLVRDPVALQRLAEPRRAQRLAEVRNSRCVGRREASVTFAFGPAQRNEEAKLASLDLPRVFDGRPYPDEVVPTAEDIEQWRVAQEEDPWWGRTRNDPDHVAKALRRLYCDVAPWPFQALLDDNGRPGGDGWPLVSTDR